MSLFLLLAAVTAAPTFACTPTQVADAGGPILCAEGPKVRLAGIATRPVNGTCEAGAPCPDASGAAARDRLVLAIAGAPLQCATVANSSAYTLATCSAGKTDLGCLMVYEGFAVPWADLGGARRCSAIL